MPTFTYPGVYIEEVPSGVRTITAVATSITAFIGRAERGPVDEPVTINNFGEFEVAFGGLGVPYPMSYAVRDFFQNGGSQAIIVRLYKKPEQADDGVATLDVNGLKLEAASPGVWANNLAVRVDRDGITDEVATRFNLDETKMFNLSIVGDPPGPPLERHLNLTVEERKARSADRVLSQQSRFVRVTDLPADVPVVEEDVEEDPDNPQPEANLKKFSEGGNSPALTAGDYGNEGKKTGLFALEKADLFNLLCIPPDTRDGTTPTEVYQSALEYCVDRRAMLIVDPPADWSGTNGVLSNPQGKLTELRLTGPEARNAALYFPRVRQTDPNLEGQTDVFVPCGIVAGVMARIDTLRGVSNAAAGTDANLSGVQSLEVSLTEGENGRLNPLGINCLRTFPVVGSVLWGSRTLRGADQLADEYKYVPVRRLALFLEESLYRGLQFAVFGPNDEPLWSQIRLNVGAFMQGLFRQGAFAGVSPREAYFVKCDSETTTPADINLGVVNVLVGFAPLKPAEFVVIKLQQLAGQLAT